MFSPYNAHMHRHGEYKMPGGKLVVADLQIQAGLLHQVAISGDFFLEPDSALDAINQALEGVSADASELQLSERIASAFPPDARLFGISAEAVAVAVRRAIASEETA